MKLHLGCGNDYRKGWVNIDSDPSVKVDIRRDLEKGLPFSDNTIEEVYARHLIEHIKDDAFLMNEIWRVCKKGASVRLVFPDGHGIGAFDWDHKSFWNMRKIGYLAKHNRKTYMGLCCDMVYINHVELMENGTKVIDVLLEVDK